MPRATKEWVGKTPDQKVPPRVRLRVFEAHDGICHISKRKIRPGEAWELEHKIALCNGGEHRESNMAPALVKAHKAKTAEDVREKAKIAKTRKAILGIKSESSFQSSRGGRIKVKVGGEAVDRKTGRPIRAKKCVDCGVYYADWPSELCPGCEAYREHTGAA